MGESLPPGSSVPLSSLALKLGNIPMSSGESAGTKQSLALAHCKKNIRSCRTNTRKSVVISIMPSSLLDRPGVAGAVLQTPL